MRFARLEIGGRLDRYVGRLFLASYATALLLVVGLAVIFDVTSNLEYFEVWKDGTRASGWLIGYYYCLHTPFVFLAFAPYVTLTAGLFTVSRLIKNNEVIAALGSGVSAHRLLAPLLIGASVAAGGMFVLREYFTAALGDQREALRDYLDNKRPEPVYENRWVRDQAGNYVRFGEFRPMSGELGAPEMRDVLAVIRSKGAVERVTADRAVWTHRDGKDGWLLVNGEQVTVDVVATRRAVDWLAGVDVPPEQIRLWIKGKDNALELSFSQVNALLARDPDSATYQTLLQYHLTFPLANLVLLLVALPFLIGRERGKSVEGVMLGLLCCVFYFSLEFVTRKLGIDGALSPLVASWLPVLVFGSLGFAFFDSMRS